jgi:hypothetical protein
MKAIAMILAVDADELVLLEVLAVGLDEVVERADQPVGEQGRDRVVGDDRDGVLAGLTVSAGTWRFLCSVVWFLVTVTLPEAHSSAARR